MYRQKHKWICEVYREMIDYYLGNIGERSKYSMYRTKITPRLVKNIVKRYNYLTPLSSNISLNGELNDRKKEKKASK